MVYHNRTFIQVLDEEIEEVRNLYDKIKADSRHSKVKTIWERDIIEIGFIAWSMSLMNLDGIKVSVLFLIFLIMIISNMM